MINDITHTNNITYFNSTQFISPLRLKWGRTNLATFVNRMNIMELEKVYLNKKHIIFSNGGMRGLGRHQDQGNRKCLQCKRICRQGQREVVDTMLSFSDPHWKQKDLFPNLQWVLLPNGSLLPSLPGSCSGWRLSQFPAGIQHPMIGNVHNLKYWSSD